MSPIPFPTNHVPLSSRAVSATIVIRSATRSMPANRSVDQWTNSNSDQIQANELPNGSAGSDIIGTLVFTVFVLGILIIAMTAIIMAVYDWLDPAVEKFPYAKHGSAKISKWRPLLCEEYSALSEEELDEYLTWCEDQLRKSLEQERNFSQENYAGFQFDREVHEKLTTLETGRECLFSTAYFPRFTKKPVLDAEDMYVC